MKIAVIGASGRSGRYFVDAAINAGLLVRAGVRNTSSLSRRDGLEIIHCDVTSKNDLDNLIKSCQVVVSLIGHVKGSPGLLQTNMTENIVYIMKKQGIKRLVSLTGTGVRQPGDKITFMDRVLNFGVSVVDPARVFDGQKHFDLIKKSGLDWTVIRVLKLQNTKPKLYKLTLNGPAKLIVSRQEVANAIVEVIQKNKFIKKAPIVSK